MSNYCSKHGKFCDNATEFGYCQTTACINHNNSKIIDNKIITNREWLNSLSNKELAEWFCNNLDYAVVCGSQGREKDCNTSYIDFQDWLQAENERICQNSVSHETFKAIMDEKDKEIAVLNKALELFFE